MFLSASLGLGGGSCCTFVGAKAGRLIDERSAPGRSVLPCEAIDVDAGRPILVRTRGQGNVKGVYLGRDCSPSPSLTLLIPGHDWSLPGSAERSDTLVLALEDIAAIKVPGREGRRTGLILGIALDVILSFMLVEFYSGFAGVPD
jgi:hypothetical protein